MDLAASRKLTAIILLTITLSACGGGGETASTPTPTPPVTPPITPPVTPPVTPPAPATIAISSGSQVNLTENGSVDLNVNIDYSGTKSVTLEVSDITMPSISVSQSTTSTGFVLTVSADEMNGKINESESITLTATDGDVTDTTTFKIVAKNESLNVTLTNAQLRHNEISFIDTAEELSNLTVYLADKSYLLGINTYDESQLWQNDMLNSISTLSSSALKEPLQILTALINSTSSITEIEANNKIKIAEEAINSVGGQFEPILEEFTKLSVPNLSSFAPLKLSKINNSYSLFYGNSSYGSGSDTKWNFNASWAILSKLLPLESELCTARNEA